MEALQYDTTYYVKIVAKDADGSAAASDAGSAQLLKADGPDIRPGSIITQHLSANSIVAAKITAGAITSSKLESELVLSTTIVAGTAGGARIELGTSGDGTGLTAYSGDGTTVKFSVNADTGDVYAAGRIDFGAGSRLDSDIMDLKELPATGFQTPAVVQTASEVDSGVPSMSVAWPSATTAGSECLMFVSIWDPDGACPTPSTPSGWSLVTSQVTSNLGVFVYRTTTGASRSGYEGITLNDTGTYVSMRLVELSGVLVGAADQTASSFSVGTVSPASGSTSTTTQTDEMLIGIVSWNQRGTDTISGETSGFASLGTLNTGVTNFTDGVTQRVYWKNVTSTGTYSFGGTLSDSRRWQAHCITLKAKTVAVDAPAADKLRIYAVDDGHASTDNDVSMLLTQGELGVEKSLEYPGLARFHAATAPSFTYVHSEFLEVAAAIIDSEPCGEGCIASISGAASGISNTGVSGHPGIARLSTGTATTGHAQVRGNATAWDVGQGRMRMGSLVRIPTVSDGTNTFWAGAGFKSADASWDAPNALNLIAFRYKHDVNSGKWQYITANSSSNTAADSGVTMTANSWYWLEVDVNAAGTEAKFYINGSLVGTATGTFPTGTLTHHVASIQKTAGATARNIDVDFYYCYVEGNTRA